MRHFPRSLLIALSASLLLTSCSDGDDEDPLALVASCSATVTGSGPRVFVSCGAFSGDMVSVDVFASGVADEVDAYNIVLNFSPAVFRYLGFAASETLFEPTACSSGTLCVDNATTNANTTGQVVYGVSRTGVDPLGVVPGPGPTRLGSLMFEAVSDSQTSLTFAGSSMPGCVGSTTTGNALMQVDSTIGSSCLVSVISGITFGPGSLTLSATLQ